MLLNIYLFSRVDLAKLEDEISRLTDDIDLILKHEVANMAEDSVLQNIYSVVENITRARIERRQLMLRKLCLAANVTHKFLYLTDLVWMLMLQESRKFKFGTCLLKETTDYFTDEVNKHKSTMVLSYSFFLFVFLRGGVFFFCVEIIANTPKNFV